MLVAISCLTLCDPMNWSMQTPLFCTISWSLLKFISIELVMLPSHLILGHPLYFLPSAFPSIRIFSKELVLCISWLKYWSFSFSISPSNEYSGLISFRMDWFDLLAVQDFQESSPAPQFKGIKSLHSALFKVQLSHLYVTTGKTKALTRWTFVGKVMSLLFNMLSRLVITFLPSCKRL